MSSIRPEAWKIDDWTNIALEVEDSAKEKLLDASVNCLLILGIVPIIVGILTGIWPIAIVTLGPWLLALLDIRQRRRARTQQ